MIQDLRFVEVTQEFQDPPHGIVTRRYKELQMKVNGYWIPVPLVDLNDQV